MNNVDNTKSEISKAIDSLRLLVSEKYQQYPLPDTSATMVLASQGPVTYFVMSEEIRQAAQEKIKELIKKL